jgi:hypothetical protein
LLIAGVWTLSLVVSGEQKNDSVAVRMTEDSQQDLGRFEDRLVPMNVLEELQREKRSHRPVIVSTMGSLRPKRSERGLNGAAAEAEGGGGAEQVAIVRPDVAEAGLGRGA